MENKYTDKTLDELSVLACEYLNCHRNTGGISEFDHSINDISRAVVIKYKEKYDKCFLGKINHYDCDRKNPNLKLVECVGQDITNFEYGFILPCNDDEVTEMINEYNKEKETINPAEIMEQIEKITQRVVALGGDFLIWS